MLALVGSVALLVAVPTATWVIPILVAAFGAFVTLTQWNIQHDNAERLQRLGDDLRRSSMQFERRLDAFVGVARGMKAILDCADGIVRTDDAAPGPGVTLPTRSFYEASQEARRALHTDGEVLRLLAEPAATRILDSFEAVLKGLDDADDRDTIASDVSVAIENVEHLRRAVPEFRRKYEDFLENARSQLRET